MIREIEFFTENEDGDDVKLTIEYEYTEGCRGSRSNGLQIDPDEPASIDILSIEDEEGNDFELDEFDTEAVVEKAFEDAEGFIEDAKVEAQIEAYEARRGRSW